MTDYGSLLGVLIFFGLGIPMVFAPDWSERVWRESGGWIRIGGPYKKAWGYLAITMGVILLTIWIVRRL